MHVGGYKEKGGIDTPMTTASSAAALHGRCRPGAEIAGNRWALEEEIPEPQIECRNYAQQFGIDKPEVADWVWPY